MHNIFIIVGIIIYAFLSAYMGWVIKTGQTQEEIFDLKEDICDLRNAIERIKWLAYNCDSNTPSAIFELANDTLEDIDSVKWEKGGNDER